MHEYLAPATLLIAVLAGIWLNRRDVASLRAEIKDELRSRFAAVDLQFATVDRRLSVLEADYKQFYGMQQKLEGRVDVLQHGR